MQWILDPRTGGAQSCDTVCADVGKTCDQPSLDNLNNNDFLFAAAFDAWSPGHCHHWNTGCTGGNNCAAWGSPFIHNSHVNDHLCWRGSPVAPCHQQPVDGNHRRLCPCAGSEPGAPTDSCEELRQNGITASGTYPLNTNSGVVNTKCLYQNGKMWTMVYKIGTGSTMKTTGQENVGALVTESNTNDSGKLSDTDIKRLCNGQYYLKQSGITSLNGGSLYCKFDDINTFADNVIVNKKCAFSYIESGAYTSSFNDASWAWNFGSWGHTGAIITQLNYRDSRRGSHVCLGCSAGGDGSCTHSGGCDTEVYCLE